MQCKRLHVEMHTEYTVHCKHNIFYKERALSIHSARAALCIDVCMHLHTHVSTVYKTQGLCMLHTRVFMCACVYVRI